MFNINNSDVSVCPIVSTFLFRGTVGFHFCNERLPLFRHSAASIAVQI